MIHPSLYKQDGKLRTDDPTELSNWLQEKLGYTIVGASRVVAARLDTSRETITVYSSGIVVCRAALAAALMKLVNNPALRPIVTHWVRKEAVPRKRTRLPHVDRPSALVVEIQGTRRFLSGTDGQLIPLARRRSRRYVKACMSSEACAIS